MTSPMFDQCMRPGCGHSRWSHGEGMCRAGPEGYWCGCESFVKNALPQKVLDEALAIAAEETPLEARLRDEIRDLDAKRKIEADREETLRVRLRALADEWDRGDPRPQEALDRHGYFNAGLKRSARQLREVLEEP